MERGDPVGCHGVWIVDPTGEVTAAGVQADPDVLAQLSSEAVRLLQRRNTSSGLVPGGHHWIRLFPLKSDRFEGVVGVWEDNHGEESLKLEVTSMAHDINNLLAVVQGHLEMMPCHDESSQASVNEALWMLERAEDLVKRLGALGRAPVAKETTPVANLREILSHLCGWLDHVGHETRLEIEGDGDAWVAMDRADCIEVFQNLFKNAVEAMPNGGPIAVEVRHRGHEVTVSVRDHGPGIRSEDLDLIFSPHFTTKDSGQGLGLYRTRVLVEQYAGRIHVVSAPERGTTFIVTLPVASDADIINYSRTTG